MNILVLIITAIGITTIITKGSIFTPFKNYLTITAASREPGVISKLLDKIVELTNCPICTGFHVGWLLGLFYGPFESYNIICNGAFYAALTYIAAKVTHDSKD